MANEKSIKKSTDQSLAATNGRHQTKPKICDPVMLIRYPRNHQRGTAFSEKAFIGERRRFYR